MITTKIDEHASPREQAFQLRDQFKRMIDQVIEGGEFPADTPWTDARFQMMIKASLRTIRPLQDAGYKLAVIKEVFGK